MKMTRLAKYIFVMKVHCAKRVAIRKEAVVVRRYVERGAAHRAVPVGRVADADAGEPVETAQMEHAPRALWAACVGDGTRGALVARGAAWVMQHAAGLSLFLQSSVMNA